MTVRSSTTLLQIVTVKFPLSSFAAVKKLNGLIWADYRKVSVRDVRNEKLQVNFVSVSEFAIVP